MRYVSAASVLKANFGRICIKFGYVLIDVTDRCIGRFLND